MKGVCNVFKNEGSISCYFKIILVMQLLNFLKITNFLGMLHKEIPSLSMTEWKLLLISFFLKEHKILAIHHVLLCWNQHLNVYSPFVQNKV